MFNLMQFGGGGSGGGGSSPPPPPPPPPPINHTGQNAFHRPQDTGTTVSLLDQTRALNDAVRNINIRRDRLFWLPPCQILSYVITDGSSPPFVMNRRGLRIEQGEDGWLLLINESPATIDASFFRLSIQFREL